MMEIPEQLGELTIARRGEGYVIRGPGSPRETLPPDEDALRQHARFDASGRYRPLSGARTLREGWQVETGPALSLERAIDAVYPLALAHRRLFAAGELRVVSLDEVLARQSGRYEDASALVAQGRERATRLLCGQCVRVPVWAGQPCDAGAIPCPEPCSVLVSLCREASLWEDEPPAPAPVDPAVEFAAFDEPGNELREAYIAALNTYQPERTAPHG